MWGQLHRTTAYYSGMHLLNVSIVWKLKAAIREVLLDERISTGLCSAPKEDLGCAESYDVSC